MSKNDFVGLPKPALNRLPIYYRRLRQAAEAGIAYLSSTDLAQSADVSEAQVRKDLSYLDIEGRPGVGYEVRQIAAYLEEFLGLINDKEAVLVGVGNLGRALISYPGFARYGLKIVACFDNDPAKIGQTIGTCEVFSVDRLPDLARRLHIQMGIITVPAEAAQEVADLMIQGGIRVIWNFAPVHLRVPEDALVQNEDLAAQLATLSHLITRQKLSVG